MTVRVEWREAVRSKTLPAVAAYADAHGVEAPDYEDSVSAHIAHLLAATHLRVRMWPEGLLAFLRDNEFKNRFTLDGEVRPESECRWNAENAMFAACGPDNFTSDVRPAYGYLHPPNEETVDLHPIGDPYTHADWYGTAVVFLQKNILRECTFVFGDSLTVTDCGRLACVCPARVQRPHSSAFNYCASTDPMTLGSFMEYSDKEGLPREYLEAQIHIPLTPEDVTAVMFLDSDQDGLEEELPESEAKHLRRLLDEFGIEVVHVTGRPRRTTSGPGDGGHPDVISLADSTRAEERHDAPDALPPS
jgi:hypothetical protein